MGIGDRSPPLTRDRARGFLVAVKTAQGDTSLPRPARRPRFLFRHALRTAVAGMALATVAAGAADTSWFQYRGPNHDGVYAGSIRTNWTEQAPRRLWRRTAEPALSSFSIRDGRAFTQARRSSGGNDREFIVALDAATGRELWATDVDLADYPNGGVGDDDGPRSTPTLDGDRVYVFTTYLKLYCLEAATGHVVWQRDFPKELGASVVEWQNAASPVLVGDLIYVNGNGSPNRLMAIRKTDGTTAWRRHDERMTQATPIYATLAGVPQVVFFTQPGLISVRPDTGELLWRFTFRFSTSTAASPVAMGDAVYCSAAYTVGSASVRVAAAGAGLSATPAWNLRNANMNHWATPVYHGGYLYGIYGQSSLSLRCIDAATGAEKWRAAQLGNEEVDYGSVLKVGGRLLVTTGSGVVFLVEPDPVACRPLQSFEALTTGKTWNSPALSDGILYIRSTTQIAAYDLTPPVPPAPLALAPAVAFAGTTARVTVRTADGSALGPTRAAGLTLEATEDSAAKGGWSALPGKAVAGNGAAVFEDPTAGSTPRRFYRVRE